MLIDANDLRAALKAVKPHAATAKNPDLNTVFLRARDGFLYLYATDQYALAESTLQANDPNALDEEFDTALSMATVIYMIADLPKSKGAEVTVTADMVHTMVTNNEARIDIIGGLSSMLRRAETETGLDDSDTAPNVNPDFLARFKTSNLRRSTDPKETPMTLRMGEKNRPLMVTYSNHFKALIMPIRKA